MQCQEDRLTPNDTMRELTLRKWHVEIDILKMDVAGVRGRDDTIFLMDKESTKINHLFRNSSPSFEVTEVCDSKGL